MYIEIPRTTNIKKLLHTMMIFVWNSFGNFMKIIYVAYYCECTINEVRNCIFLKIGNVFFLNFKFDPFDFQAKKTINIIHSYPLDEKDIELKNEVNKI